MKLYNAVKMQLIVMIHKKNFQTVFTLLYLYSIATYLYHAILGINQDISSLLSADALYVGNAMGAFFRYFSALFPFLVVFPFSFSYLNDTEVGMITFIQSRMGSQTYYISKLITSFTGGFLIIFLPFLINILLLSITFPNNNNTSFGYYYTPSYCQSLIDANTGFPFIKLYIISPVLYNVVYLIILSLFSGLMSVLSLSCSYWLKKYKLLLLLPIYLIFFATGTLTVFSYNSGNTYINFNLLDYVSINNYEGKNGFLFLLFCFIVLLFSLLSTWRISKLEHL